MKLQQRLPHGLRHQAADFRLAMKFHLSFRGVNVDVHRCRVNFQKQAAHRIAPLHQRGVVTFQQREVQPAILHRPTVDEQALVFARSARDAGRADETPETEEG